MGRWPQAWLGLIVMAVVTPLLFWIPIPGLAGFVGGWAGGVVVGVASRAALMALIPALLFFVLGMTAGLAVVEIFPFDSVLKPLFVFWAVLSSLALVVGAYLGASRGARAAAPFAGRSQRGGPAWADERFWPWLRDELREELGELADEWRGAEPEAEHRGGTSERATRVFDRLRYPRAASGGLLTILFTDMVGSTALTQQLGDAGAQSLVRRHNAAVRDALGRHGGAEIKHTGDGIMASFPSAVAAVEAAIAVQLGLREDGGDGAAEQVVRVRIGINAGEPIVEGNDLFGTAVQLASRIRDHAAPGQILVSDVVRQLVAGKPFRFQEQDLASLRGFEEPVRVFALDWQERAGTRS